MNMPNEDQKPTDNAEMPKQQASGCGPGCGCHSTGATGKARWVVGALILAAAGVMVARAVIKSNGASNAGVCAPSAGAPCCPK